MTNTNPEWFCPYCFATDWHQFPDDCYLGPTHRTALLNIASNYSKNPEQTRQAVKDYFKQHKLWPQKQNTQDST